MHLEWSSRTGGCWLMSLNVTQSACSGNALYNQHEKSALGREKAGDHKEFVLTPGLWNQDFAWACFLLALQLLFVKISMQLRHSATKKPAKNPLCASYYGMNMICLQGQPVSDMFRRWWCLESVNSLVCFSSGLLVAFLCSTQLLIYVEISWMTTFHPVKSEKV